MEFTWFDEDPIEQQSELEKLGAPCAEEVLFMDLTPEKIEVYADTPGVLRTR
jgi:hypothetical protein